MSNVIDKSINDSGDKQNFLYAEYINLCNSNKIPIKYKTAENFSLQFKNYLNNQNVIDKNINDNINTGGDKQNYLYEEYRNLCNCNKIPIKYKTFKKLRNNYGFLKNTLSHIFKNTLSNIFTLGIMYIILIGI